MAIYTSYYGSKLIDPKNQYLVKISNSAPAAIQINDDLKEAIPSWNNLVRPYKAGQIGDDEYTQGYLTQLNNKESNLLRSLEQIRQNAGNKDLILLCYEKPGAFCHRHILARWLSTRLNEEVTELTTTTESTLF